MNFTYFHSIDWDTFEKKYPSAYNFLIHESLKQEKLALGKEIKWATDPRRKTWIEARLNELSQLNLD